MQGHPKFLKSWKFKSFLENCKEGGKSVWAQGNCPFILLHLSWCQHPQFYPRDEMKVPNLHDYKMIQRRDGENHSAGRSSYTFTPREDNQDASSWLFSPRPTASVSFYSHSVHSLSPGNWAALVGCSMSSVNVFQGILVNTLALFKRQFIPAGLKNRKPGERFPWKIRCFGCVMLRMKILTATENPYWLKDSAGKLESMER